MNTKHFTRILMLTVGAIASSAGLLAQNDPKLNANVPFAFTLKGQAVPAGKYEVSLVRSSGAVNFIRFRNRDSDRTVVTMTQAGATATGNGPEISFHCVKGACAAAAVSTGAATYGMPVKKAKSGDDGGVVLTRVRLTPAGM